ncbi:MAG: 30S ribosomal protein S3 [Candidatus Andersenbacteria bacterium]|nr:30S ribosomal protein S3 [Candidatus Andersenbacteria bacterium]
MGRKTNPIILRVSSIVRSWDSRWFSDRRTAYREQLREDLIIRRYFARKLRAASVSRIEIERGGAASRGRQELVLTVHTSRPALLIGRGGSGIELIQRDLKQLLGGRRLSINVQEIRNPDTDAVAVATQVVEQLERRLPFRRVLKQAVSRARQAGALGVRVAVAGRLNGADIARREWLAEGNVPLQTFRSDVAYAVRCAFTPYGTVGVKVWVNRGDLLPEEEAPGVERKARSISRRRGSLAEKAALAKAAKQAKS